VLQYGNRLREERGRESTMEVGDKVTMLVHGVGVTSKERRTIEDIEEGVVSLENTPKQFDVTGKHINPEKYDLGFKFELEL
jgi:hypothetical protein